MSRLSGTQLQVLQNAADGRPLLAHAHGRSAHGGGQQTVFSLRKRGMLDDDKLTDKGRDALNAWNAEFNRSAGIVDPSTLDPRERLVDEFEAAVLALNDALHPDDGKDDASQERRDVERTRAALLAALGVETAAKSADGT